MPKPMAEGNKGVFIELREELLAKIKGMADRNGRSFRDEVSHALERHLKHPPVIRIIDDSPALAPVEVEPPTTKSVRGKSKK